MNLLALPEEVLLTILSSLNACDILAFSAVSHYTNKLYNSSSRLQYIAELDAAGSVDPSLHASYPLKGRSNTENDNDDGREGVVSTSEKLNYLRTREQRWRELDLLRNARGLPLDHPSEVSIYDLSAGVFAYSEFEREYSLMYVDLREVSRRGMTGQVSSQVNGSAAVSGAATPTPVPAADETNANSDADETMEVVLPLTDAPWQSFAFHDIVADFGLALKEHDLIVLITHQPKVHDTPGVLNLPSMQEIKLKLYEFSSQKLHPLAKEPVLKLAEKPAIYRRPSPVVEVSGKYIAVVLTFPRSMVDNAVEDVFVINWQTGSIVYHQTCESLTYSCLAFVTPSLFVIPNMPENSLDLVHIFVDPDGIERVCWLRKLLLPELVDGYKIRNAVCRGDPNPMESTSDVLNPEGQGAGKKDPSHVNANVKRYGGKWGAARYGISADPLRAIISFKFIIARGSPPFASGPAVHLVLHRSSLAALALDDLEERKKCLSIVGNDDYRDSIPKTKWAEWGPPVTRWRLEDDYTEWVTTSAGQRQVAMTRSTESPFAPIIVVRDFNPYEVRRVKAKARAKAKAEKCKEGKNIDEEEVHIDSNNGEPRDPRNDDRDGWSGYRVQDRSMELQSLDDMLDATEREDTLIQLAANWPFAYVEDENAYEHLNPADQAFTLQAPTPHPAPAPDAASAPASTSTSTTATTTNPSESTSATDLDSSSTYSGSSISSTFIFDLPERKRPSMRRSAIRVRDTNTTFKVPYYEKDALCGSLPCVEYDVEGDDHLYSGLLMDEERIIGYMEETDDLEQVERMLNISVFSMYP